MTEETLKDMKNRIREYDLSHPKMDELKFIKGIMDNYDIDRKEAIKLIQPVRKYDKRGAV